MESQKNQRWLLILGTLFIFGGLAMVYGTLIKFIEKTSTYSVASDILGLIFMGLIPMALGGFFLYRAMGKKK